MKRKYSDLKSDQFKLSELVCIGLAVGDALGATSEFQLPEDVGTNCVEAYSEYNWPAKLAGGGALHWGQGEPTDDTDMAMCILKSFVQQGGKFDPVDIGKEFVSWMRAGPADIGNLTRTTLSIVARPKYTFYRGAYDQWIKNPFNSPNGSLMRNGVIPALFYPKDETDCIDATVLHSILTHYSPLSVLCCVIQSLLIRNAILQKPSGPPTIEDIQNLIQTSWQKWKTSTSNEHCLHWLKTVQYVLDTAEQQIVEELKNFETTNFYKISYKNRAGYSVLTLKIGLWSLYWSYSNTAPPDIPAYLPKWVFNRHQFDTIMWVVLIGADADTYGATAGPLLAAYHGNIHPDFMENLMVKDQVSSYYSQLIPILNKKET